MPLSFFAELRGRMIVFGTALPAIGLIVGAMVIMNIMLVAVAGGRMKSGSEAIGARQKTFAASSWWKRPRSA